MAQIVIKILFLLCVLFFVTPELFVGAFNFIIWCNILVSKEILSFIIMTLHDSSLKESLKFYTLQAPNLALCLQLCTCLNLGVCPWEPDFQLCHFLVLWKWACYCITVTSSLPVSLWNNSTSGKCKDDRPFMLGVL